MSELDRLNKTQMVYSQYVSLEPDENMLTLKNQLADLTHDLAVAEGRVIDLSSGKSKASTMQSLSSTVTLQSGDFIVLKPKSGYAMSWAPLGHGWQHAILVYNGSTLVEAVDPNNLSRKFSWTQFMQKNQYHKFDKAILVKMGLNSWEQSSIRSYMDLFQVGIPYPQQWQIPFTKYSVDTFYCSSLVWAAHKNSAKYIDLDDVESPLMVWPVDLLNSTNTGVHYSISW